MMLMMLLGRQGLRSHHHAHGRVAFGSTCRSAAGAAGAAIPSSCSRTRSFRLHLQVWGRSGAPMMLMMLLGWQGLRSHHHAHGRVAFGSTCRPGKEAEPHDAHDAAGAAGAGDPIIMLTDA